MAQTWEFKAYATLADYENCNSFLGCTGFTGIRAAKADAAIELGARGKNAIVKFQTMDCEDIRVLYHDCRSSNPWWKDYENKAALVEMEATMNANKTSHIVLVVGDMEFYDNTVKIHKTRLIVPMLNEENAEAVGEYIRNTNNDDFGVFRVNGTSITLVDRTYTKHIISKSIRNRIMAAV